MAALAGPFNTGWYYQVVLQKGALAPVPRTGTKGWAFSPGRAAPAREPGQTGPSRPVLMPERVAVTVRKKHLTKVLVLKKTLLASFILVL